MKELFEEYREFVPDFDSFLMCLRAPLPNHLRVNRLKTSPAAVIAMLDERGISLKPAGVGDDVLYEAPMDLMPGKLLEYFLGHPSPGLDPRITSMVLAPAPIRPC
jgi:16S rRNA C967 or C1407 C5-methylase (RsmB/RsmF family)